MVTYYGIRLGRQSPVVSRRFKDWIQILQSNRDASEHVDALLQTKYSKPCRKRLFRDPGDGLGPNSEDCKYLRAQLFTKLLDDLGPERVRRLIELLR